MLSKVLQNLVELQSQVWVELYCSHMQHVTADQGYMPQIGY